MIETRTSPAWAPFAPRSLYSTTYPLDDFYAVRRLPLPLMELIEPDQVPEPYRSLLVHDSDMTSRLEAFHKSKIHIRALARHHHGRDYFREVVLELDGSRQPVEFGATKVNLDLFPAAGPRRNPPRGASAGRDPARLRHHFFQPARRLFSRRRRCRSLAARSACPARRSSLAGATPCWTPGSAPMAEIVEILPMTPPQSLPAFRGAHRPGRTLRRPAGRILHST